VRPLFKRKTKDVNDINIVINEVAKVGALSREQIINVLNNLFTVNCLNDAGVTSIVLTILDFIGHRNPQFLYNSLADFASGIAKRMGYDLVIDPEKYVAERIAKDNKKRKVDNYIG
jgi:hypothetical protein